MKGFIEVHDDQGDENLVNIAHIVNVRGSIIYTDDSAPFQTDIECEENYIDIKRKIEEAEK